jgi:protocatechuate 3,4-dioxygenase beta subunit
MALRRALPIVLSTAALFAGLLATTGGQAAGATPTATVGSQSASTGAPDHPTKDTLPPGPITGLQTSANGLKTITLSWTNPTDQDFTNVLIRRAVGDQPPLSPSDGTLIAAVGKHRTSYVDHGLTPATSYSYTLFARDRHHNLSTATSISASTLSTNAKTGLRGKLTDQQGRPIAGLQVDIRHADTGNGAAGALTNSTGQFTATNLQPGNYLICYFATNTTVGHSATGYLPGCYRQQPYGYGTSGTQVTVVAGKLTAGITDYLQAAGAISGRVTDDAGNSLQNVSVTVSDPTAPDYPSFASETAADGSYRVANLPASGGYQVCFYSGGAIGGASTGYLDQCYDHQQPYGGTGDPVAVVAGQTHSGVNAQLAMAGAITGQVVDDQGQPAVGIDVIIFGGGGAFTDAQGKYTASGLATGSYGVCFDGGFAISPATPYGYANGCASSAYTIDVTAGQTATLNGSVGVAGAVGGTVSGLDGPVEGVLVEVISPTEGEVGGTSTDAEGNYQITGVLPGSYQICFDPSYTSGGYLRSCYQDQPSGSGTLVTVNRAQLTTVSQQLAQGASITGTITDASGSPISGVQVSAIGVSDYQYYSAVTDDRGQYSIGSLTAQDYQVCFDPSYAHGSAAGGYTAECFDNQPSIDTATPVSVPATGSVVVNAQLAAGSAITGRVTGSDGSQLGEVWVQATSTSTGQGSTVMTGVDGSYRLVGLAAGDYTVCFDAVNVHSPAPTGYVSECNGNHLGTFGGDPVHVDDGVTTSGVDAELAVGAEITGTVTDPSGAPLQSVYVSAQATDGGYFSETGGMSGIDGRYLITGLPSLSLAVCFQDYSGANYAVQCYQDKPDWTSADPVTPVAGQITPNIDATLRP